MHQRGSSEQSTHWVVFLAQNHSLLVNSGFTMNFIASPPHGSEVTPCRSPSGSVDGRGSSSTEPRSNGYMMSPQKRGSSEQRAHMVIFLVPQTNSLLLNRGFTTNLIFPSFHSDRDRFDLPGRTRGPRSSGG